MVCVMIAGVDSRVIIVQTSMPLMPDQLQLQSVKKMRRLKVDYTRPSSFHGIDDNDDSNNNNNNDNNNEGGAVNLKLLWLSHFKELDLISTPLSSSVAPSAIDLDVVPDISRLDFRRSSAHSRGSHTRQGTGSETLDHRVWWLTGAGRITQLVPRSVVDGLTGRTVSVGREWSIAILAAVVACLAAILLLILVAVWVRRRRRVMLRTSSKLPLSRVFQQRLQ